MLPEVLKLAESPLLQGGALSAMLDFFKTIVAAGVSGLGHSDLLALLAHPVLGSKGGSIHKVCSCYCFALCVTILSVYLRLVVLT